MLLHHSNKLSRNGSQTGIQAYRDATALFDSVRAAWYLRGMTVDEVKAQGDTPEDGVTFSLLENSKNNYLPPLPDLVVRRTGFNYSCKTATAKVVKLKKEAETDEELRLSILNAMQGFNKVTCGKEDMALLFSHLSNKKRAAYILEKLVTDGFIDREGKGANTKYKLTEAGTMYGLEIEETGDII
jgi:predicted transcriptional regulator